MRLPLTVFCVVLGCCATAASAQQPAGSQPGVATGQERSSAPTADPFKNGGRPESHGGTVQQPAANSAQAISPESRKLLEEVRRTTVTAQQYGNLASMRHTSGAVHDLADRMVVTNSRINKAIAGALPETRGQEDMSAAERSTFDSLARSGNEREFGISIAQWVTERYPATISALETLAGTPPMRDLSGSVPEMKSQLADAQKMLREANSGSTGSLQPAAPGKKSD